MIPPALMNLLAQLFVALFVGSLMMLVWGLWMMGVN